MSEINYNVRKLATDVDRAESVLSALETSAELAIAKFFCEKDARVWATAEFLVGEAGGCRVSESTWFRLQVVCSHQNEWWCVVMRLTAFIRMSAKQLFRMLPRRHAASNATSVTM